MAVPVINTTTSILGYKQWEEWEFQPFAVTDSTITSWACPNLPTGLSINTSTGLISGAAEVQGVFTVGLTATNSTGVSAPLALTIGIEAAPAALTSSGYEVDIDVVTREVKLVGQDSVKLYAAFDDDILIWCRFKKGESYLDLDITGLKLALREVDSGSSLVLGDTWVKKGSGSGAVYGLYAKADSTALAGVIPDYEADSDTQFDGQTEIEFIQNNPDEGDGFGPETLTMSTRRFPIQIGSQYIPAS